MKILARMSYGVQSCYRVAGVSSEMRFSHSNCYQAAIVLSEMRFSHSNCYQAAIVLSEMRLSRSNRFQTATVPSQIRLSRSNRFQTATVPSQIRLSRPNRFQATTAVPIEIPLSHSNRSRAIQLIGEVFVGSPFLKYGFRLKEPRWSLGYAAHRRCLLVQSQFIFGYQNGIRLGFDILLEALPVHGLIPLPKPAIRLKVLTELRMIKKKAAYGKRLTERESLAILLETTDDKVLDTVLEIIKWRTE
jgi:hypothetical protein